jgi:T5SS/PEP-CTERM-associated repeat protein
MKFLVFEQLQVKVGQSSLVGQTGDSNMKREGLSLEMRPNRCGGRWVLAALAAAVLGGGLAHGDVVSGGDTSDLVDNDNGTWTVEDVELNAGINSYGYFNVTGGSEFYSPYQPNSAYLSTDVGENEGSSGSISVSGEGSRFVSQGGMVVGDEGGGGFAISDGGSGYASNLSIGGGLDGHFGSGTVTVDGGDSSLDAGSELSIGNFSSGKMTVTNSATVSSNFISIGGFEGSNGDLQINTDSNVECGTMTIGYGATGSVEIASGGTVTLDQGGFLDLGGSLEGSQGDGTLTIDGNTSLLSVDGGIYVADHSTGEIDATNYAQINGGGDLNIGSNATGIMNVKSGSAVEIGGGLYMGPNANGNGTLNIDGAGSYVDIAGNMVIGGGATGAGTIDVTNGGRFTVDGTGYNYLGDYGSGELYISGGSTVVMGSTYVANATGGDGYISVDGSGSKLTVDGFLSIGTWNTGEMDITNGAQVVANSVYIGDVGGMGTGTVIVDGAGSLLNQSDNSGNIIVGNATGTTGTLTVRNQATVTGNILFIGENSGATGTVTVDGDGTTMTFGNFITVGDTGVGNMGITNKAVVTSVYGFIGGGFGSDGILTVNGAGSEWHVSSLFSIGTFFGTATVNVQNGGLMTSDDAIHFGEYEGSNGVATIDGSGSAFNCTNAMIVGLVSDGTLTIQNQATSTSGSLMLGESGGSNGTVNIIGGSTTVEPLASIGGGGSASASMTTGATTIGESGTGILSITAGGLLTSDGPGIIGDAFTAGESGGSDSIGIGTATISDPGSAWNLSANPLTIGNAGSGKLIIENGATVNSGIGSIASAAGSTGSVIVTGSGSIWNVGSTDLTIAAAGTGSLSINTGGAVTHVNNAIVGSGSGSSGSVIVAGPGTSWALADNLTIGESGHGVMSISGTATVNDVNGVIGDQSGGIGRMTIDGTGGASTWTNSGDLTVGNSGTGTLTVQNGGKAKSNNGILAYDLNSTGMATITNSGSSWAVTGEIVVGRGGSGTLDITSKGKVTDNEAHIGLGALANGMVLIDGSGSQWLNDGPLTIGENGTGTLTAQNGGGLNSTNAVVALNPGSSGTALITGSGSLWHVGGSLSVGGSATAAGGIGSVTVNKSGTLTIDGTLTIWPTGTVDLDGGTHSFGGLSIIPGGTLEMSKSKLTVAYTGTAPTTTIRGALFSGFAKGNWDGTGITSSAALNEPGTGIGYVDEGGGEEELMYTFDGDTNLDGFVDAVDLSDMFPGGSDWNQGDFNYDGTVNGDDFSLFQLGAAEQSDESIAFPEPGLAIYGLAPVMLLIRRRRRR